MLVPEPTVIKTAPALPDEESPDPINSDPLLPDVVPPAPVLSIKRPLTPAVPAFAVCNTIAPLLLADE